MSDFRSKRSRKQVDYSQFAASGNDLDDDDDFADVTPPPNKKPKKSVPPKPKSTNQEKKPKDAKTRKERVPVYEKNFERELQLAMEISMNESTNPETRHQGEADGSDCEPGITGESFTVLAEVEGEANLAPPPGGHVHVSSDSFENTAAKSEHITKINQDSDLIEVLGQDVIVVDSRSNNRQKRKAANTAATHWAESDDDDDDSFVTVKKGKKAKKAEEDSVYDSDSDSLDSPSESGDNWDPSDNDSDFDAGKKKANSTKANTKSSKTNAESAKTNTKSVKKTEPKPTTNGVSSGAVAVKKQSAVSTKTACKENSMQSPVSKQYQSPSTKPCTSSIDSGSKKHLGAGIPRKPASSLTSESPKGSLCGGTSVKSPSGGLRLGLSKKARIKPLHASVNNVH